MTWIVPAAIVPPMIVAAAVEVSLVFATDALPAIAPPLPPVLFEVFFVSPAAVTARSPVRLAAVVMPLPTCASVVT